MTSPSCRSRGAAVALRKTDTITMRLRALAVLLATCIAVTLLPTSTAESTVVASGDLVTHAAADDSQGGRHWWSGWHFLDDRRNTADDGNARRGLDSTDALSAASNARKAVALGASGGDHSADMFAPRRPGDPWVHVDKRTAVDGPTASTQGTDALYRAAGLTRRPTQAAAGTATTPPGTPVAPGLTQHVTPSCTGTGTDGNRVQVLYARESGQTDRFAAVLPLLEDYVARVDDVFAVSSGQTGGGRRVRWVQTPACAPDIRQVVLPSGALGSSAPGTFDAVRAAGYDARNRKYLVFAEGYNLDNGASCGVGEFYEDSSAMSNLNNGYASLIARVDCWAGTTAAHELMHTLGAVQGDAPHATAAGHCTDASEIMCYNDGTGVPTQVCAAANAWFYDCNSDDYFSTSPAAGSYLGTHWNTAQSSFLDTVTAIPVVPSVSVTSNRQVMRSGDTAALAVTGSRPLSYTWAVSPAAVASARGCLLDTSAGATVHLTCQAIGTRNVTVTVTGTDPLDSTVAKAVKVIAVSDRPAPTVTVTGPARAAADTPLVFTATPAGLGPFTYAWTLPGSRCAFAGADDEQTVAITCGGDAAGSPVNLNLTTAQVDAQTATWSSTTQKVVSTANPTPTTSTIAATQSGATVTLSGELFETASGARLPNVTVPVEVMWQGTSTWVTLAKVTTTSAGRLTYSRTMTTRAGSFRFGYAGSPDGYGPAAAGTVFVKVPVTITATVRRGSPNVLTAVVATASGTRLSQVSLTLQRRTSTGAWARVSTVRATTAGVAVAKVRPGRRTTYRWTSAATTTYRGAVSNTNLVYR